MQKSYLIAIAIGLAVLGASIYTYRAIQSPEPTQQEVAANSQMIPVATLLIVTAAENEVARAFYTRAIVEAGEPVGLAFGDGWHDATSDVGPLPFHFLRGAADSVAQSGVQLDFFLGSDAPLNPANHFRGEQIANFKQLQQTQQAQFFYDEANQRHTAMFPDLAHTNACVTCHNLHPDTPKRDWQRNDVMGATTWTYPEAHAAVAEVSAIRAALQQGFRASYRSYLDKVATFANPPQIGDQWPRDGYYLPSVDVFMAQLANEIADVTKDISLVPDSE